MFHDMFLKRFKEIKHQCLLFFYGYIKVIFIDIMKNCSNCFTGDLIKAIHDLGQGVVDRSTESLMAELELNDFENASSCTRLYSKNYDVELFNSEMFLNMQGMFSNVFKNN